MIDSRFHVKSEEVWTRAALWAGLEPSPRQLSRLGRYRRWLVEEALPAGGIGPNEAERVDSRHIADSIVFAAPLPPRPAEVLDVGSGAGLPGVPLAILMPDTLFHLLDRSGRRAALVRRAVRILALDNVTVREGDIGLWSEQVPVVVSRASLSPQAAAVAFTRILAPGGVAVVGGSWRAQPVVEGLEPLSVPAGILDHEAWLLIMRQT